MLNSFSSSLNASLPFCNALYNIFSGTNKDLMVSAFNVLEVFVPVKAAG